MPGENLPRFYNEGEHQRPSCNELPTKRRAPLSTCAENDCLYGLQEHTRGPLDRMRLGESRRNTRANKFNREPHTQTCNGQHLTPFVWPYLWAVIWA